MCVCVCVCEIDKFDCSCAVCIKIMVHVDSLGRSSVSSLYELHIVRVNHVNVIAQVVCVH